MMDGVFFFFIWRLPKWKIASFYKIVAWKVDTRADIREIQRLISSSRISFVSNLSPSKIFLATISYHHWSVCVCKASGCSKYLVDFPGKNVVFFFSDSVKRPTVKLFSSVRQNCVCRRRSLKRVERHRIRQNVERKWSNGWLVSLEFHVKNNNKNIRPTLSLWARFYGLTFHSSSLEIRTL